MFQVLCVSSTPLYFIEVCLFTLSYSIQVPSLYSNFTFLSSAVGVSAPGQELSASCFVLYRCLFIFTITIDFDFDFADWDLRVPTLSLVVK
ncbi:hypothetical protein HanIR_Chr17g0846711 [Helianthus annuus]|nr:hypothetical protein HanIR_Chr17g0846711 [Helianthus annuus]